MRFDRPRTLRQSMTWLHTWSGLLLGWLLFAVFVTGTLSFFRDEITLWMQPERHFARNDGLALERAQEILTQRAPSASQWSIALPGPRSPTMNLSWPLENRASGERARPREGGMPREEGRSHENDDLSVAAPRPEAQQMRRQQMQRLEVDPTSGEVLQPRKTVGGNFFYRFHFELYGVERSTGRWIVGIATMFMLIAIISGVIVHRNIFKDFFTFRPGKGKRAWLDAHNASSVLSLPFHLVITFSGLMLLAGLLMPTAIDRSYDGDLRAFNQELRGRNMAPPPTASGRRAPLGDLAAMRELAEQHWSGAPAGSVRVFLPGDRDAIVEIGQEHGSSLGNRGASERIRFNGVTGEMLEVLPPATSSAIGATWNALSALHLGRFASPLPRWLLFLAGVGGSIMIASGLVMWVVSRARKRENPQRPPFGQRLVEIFNVAGIAGLLLAIVACLWANRLLPAELPGRELLEVKTFFIVWAVSLAHAAWFRHKIAWSMQLALVGLLFALLPLLNALTGGLHLAGSLFQGNWLLAGFDLCALLFGIALLVTAHRVFHHVPAERRVKPQTEPQPVAADEAPIAVQPFLPQLETEES